MKFIKLLTIMALLNIQLMANIDIDKRIKSLEIELQKVMKSTYLPSDEQISRIKKEIDLLKMQQELEAIKRRQGIITQAPKQQTPQYYESQRLKIQDSRIQWANVNTQKQKANYNRSGGFVGFGIGGGGANMSAKASVGMNIGSDSVSANQTIKYYEGGGVDFELISGYNQFFTQYIGLRYYANFSLSYMIMNVSGIIKDYLTALGNEEMYNMNAILINYGANVDFVGNFYTSANVDLGGFVGFGIGGDSWIIKAKLFEQHLSPPPSVFNVWLNAGLRANIATHHGIELVARVPFLKATIFSTAMNLDNFINSKMKMFITNPYNVTLRYVYNF